MTDESAGKQSGISLSGADLARRPADCIAAGLKWLAQAHQEAHWTDLTTAGSAASPWVTSYVLARLGEFPRNLISRGLGEQIERSLDWLEQTRVAGSGWGGFLAEPDAFATSWAIMALRSHGRSVARSALDLVLRCRQANGGFASYPPDGVVASPLSGSSLEVTVTALRAISMCDSAAIDFLASRLRGDVPASAPARLARLYVCSEILDWENGLAPRSLVQQLAQSALQIDSDKPYEQALLLRCLLRLRNHRTWQAAAALREMQGSDGAWPACAVLAPSGQPSAAVSPVSFADTGVISTVTALSALVMSESQPGLYFGSDLPRRFRAS